MTVHSTGWQQLHGSKKWHYFDADRRSLCGGWMTLARDFYQGADDSPDNCAACRKRRERMKATTASASGDEAKRSETEAISGEGGR